MISKKKVWICLYTGTFLIIISFVWHSDFVHVHSYSSRTQNWAKASVLAKNVSSIELLINGIANVSAMEPPEEVSYQCHPPDLSPRENINCSQHPGLSGDYFVRTTNGSYRDMYFFLQDICFRNLDKLFY